jgi:hypothetical protein
VISYGNLKRIQCISAIVIGGVIPLACAPPPPSGVETGFLGDWVAGENASITIRPDTVVQHQPDGENTTLDKSTCRGVFRFGYGTRSREALTDLVSRQPDLRRKLSDLLVEPSYPIAELDCDRGDQTYVLLNNRQLLAIYRDGDIGVVDRLARR